MKKNMVVVSPRYAYIASMLQAEAAKPEHRDYTLSRVLGAAFVWSKQPEGMRFWQRVHKNLWSWQ